jgi:hypothetical protein
LRSIYYVEAEALIGNIICSIIKNLHSCTPYHAGAYLSRKSQKEIKKYEKAKVVVVVVVLARIKSLTEGKTRKGK